MSLLAAANQAAPLSMTTLLSPLIGVFFLSLVLTLVLTPLMRRIAIRNGIVDWPDLKRKAHVEPVAYLGGVGLFLGWLGGVVLSFYLFYPLGSEAPTRVAFPVTIIIGAAIITLTGLADDVFGMSPRVKVGGQFITAAALTWRSDMGIRIAQDLFVNIHDVFITHPANAPDWVPPHLLCYVTGAAIITFMVVGGCNSLNLLDGLDGLAAGVSGIAAVGFLFIALYVAAHPYEGSTLADLSKDPVRIVMCLALLGAVLGFLPYNFNPAKIFMGDAGSLLLGYLCVATILQFAYVSYVGPLLVMAALIVFALPIADTTLAIVRRKMRGQPIFSPDNQHIHHLCFRTAQRLGLGPRASVKAAVLAMYAIAIVFAVLGCTLGVESHGQAVVHRWRYVLVVFGVLFGSILVIAYKGGHHYLLAMQAGQAKAGTTQLPPVNSTESTGETTTDDLPETSGGSETSRAHPHPTEARPAPDSRG